MSAFSRPIRVYLVEYRKSICWVAPGEGEPGERRFHVLPLSGKSWGLVAQGTVIPGSEGKQFGALEFQCLVKANFLFNSLRTIPTYLVSVTKEGKETAQKCTWLSKNIKIYWHDQSLGSSSLHHSIAPCKESYALRKSYCSTSSQKNTTVIYSLSPMPSNRTRYRTCN
jgi:hypothetical protein